MDGYMYIINITVAAVGLLDEKLPPPPPVLSDSSVVIALSVTDEGAQEPESLLLPTM
jgi:hypothetical protein